jgi:hypothetical protein
MIIDWHLIFDVVRWVDINLPLENVGRRICGVAALDEGRVLGLQRGGPGPIPGGHDFSIAQLFFISGFGHGFSEMLRNFMQNEVL